MNTLQANRFRRAADVEIGIGAQSGNNSRCNYLLLWRRESIGCRSRPSMAKRPANQNQKHMQLWKFAIKMRALALSTPSSGI